MKETDLLFQGLQLTFLPRKVYVIVIIKTALIFSQQKTDRQNEKKHLSDFAWDTWCFWRDDDVDEKHDSDFSDNIYTA